MLPFVFKPYLLLAAFVFMVPLEKRRFWGLRLTAMIALIFGFAYLGTWVVLRHYSVINIANAYADMQQDLFLYTRIMFFVIFIEFLLIVATMCACCRISFSEALYGATCAYVARHVAATLLTLLTQPAAVRTFSNYYQSFSTIFDWIVNLSVFLFCYFFIARPLVEKGHYEVGRGMLLFSSLVVFIFSLGLSQVSMAVYNIDHSRQFYICQLFNLLCNIFLLWVQVFQKKQTILKVEIETEKLLHEQQKEQYHLSKENMELIQLKAHDLKHQIAALRMANWQENLDTAGGQNVRDEWKKSLENVENSIASFEANAQTGNEVLDVVLTQKCLTCLKKGIKWTFMADGKLLSFMDSISLFTLFSNALDNAIENVEQLQDDDKKIISLVLQQKNDMVLLQFENYYEHALQEDGSFFATSKANKNDHGFGLRSMEKTVRQYHGTMRVTTREHIFRVSILFPRKQAPA